MRPEASPPELISSMGLSSAATRLEWSTPQMLAAVDDGPLAALADPDGHRLHGAAAVGGPVPRLVIQVDAGKAVGAVVAVLGSGSLRPYRPAADPAGEYIPAGVTAGSPGGAVSVFAGFAGTLEIPPWCCLTALSIPCRRPVPQPSTRFRNKKAPCGSPHGACVLIHFSGGR